MLLQQMPILGISPDVISFNAAITACSRQMQWQVALDSEWHFLTVGDSPWKPWAGNFGSLNHSQIVGLRDP